MATQRLHVIAVIVAGVHLLGASLTAWYVSGSSEAQAPLVWIYWMFIDLPWSLPLWELMNSSFFVIHGVIGTVWWYFLVVLIGKLVAFVRSK